MRPHLVQQAASFLQSSPATPKEKLTAGGKLLLAAMMVSKDWTPKLLDRARTACKFFFEHGSLDRTVRGMAEMDASRYLRQFTKDVTQLANDIEQFRNKQPRQRRS